MGARGPLPQPAEVLKLTGHYREDRHAELALIPQADGSPIRPKGLKGEALAEWNRIVPRLVAMKIVGTVDSSVIVGACRLWALFCKAASARKIRPCDVTRYHAAYMTCVTQLGLSPMARCRIKVEKPSDKPKGVQGFSRKRSG